jgi:hypothetical protein
MSDLMRDMAKVDFKSLVAEVLSGGNTFGSGLPLSARTDGSVQNTDSGGRTKGSLEPEGSVPQRRRS